MMIIIIGFRDKLCVLRSPESPPSAFVVAESGHISLVKDFDLIYKYFGA
jgi:hypothetical protein